ncbi:L-2,4-diaminobutyrate decarboxylase [Promicromonospora sp. AC04]|uniref:pyridoxal phosphate-dependent decarboxylase family protein n=1 Tax=Promicromonospora sp. AC04 TaxID=2135723 RepID=UPI000D44D9BD|nr:pyridoxal-dependent decarboxylase [Promicromonospora sp. AC04]PUB24365.1 L-2,4-diaminobutyrate decarboxylase [Promicromonospora sp. AC04]
MTLAPEREEIHPIGSYQPAPAVTRDDQVRSLLRSVIDTGMEFKGREQIYGERLAPEAIRDRVLDEFPETGTALPELIEEFKAKLLPLCKNEASPQFLGFGDTGDDPASLAGGLLSMFTQQNLINQSFDSPSATFAEIAVLRWTRDLLGLANPAVSDVTSVWQAGGVVTTGGTMSNTIAMMLARENKIPGSMQTGITDPSKLAVVVPRGIGHYSVRSSLAWIGCGSAVIEVDTDGFRYDLDALRRALEAHQGRIMAVVAYAGDSRAHTVEDLHAVHDAVRSADPSIWLHADACWGFAATFSPATKHLVDGIELYDSITVDPHKVMAVPYAVSAVLTREVGALRAISSHSDLIMQEDFAFGQVTPFVGSKPWSSLKLWMMMRAHGRAGLAAIMDRRMAVMRGFVAELDARPAFVRLHDPDLTAQAFLWIPPDEDHTMPDIERINAVNTEIHKRLLADGSWHLHQFTIPDPGRFERGRLLRPLRFMSINRRIERRHVVGVLDFVESLGRQVVADPNFTKER